MRARPRVCRRSYGLARPPRDQRIWSPCASSPGSLVATLGPCRGPSCLGPQCPPEGPMLGSPFLQSPAQLTPSADSSKKIDSPVRGAEGGKGGSRPWEKPGRRPNAWSLSLGMDAWTRWKTTTRRGLGESPPPIMASVPCPPLRFGSSLSTGRARARLPWSARTTPHPGLTRGARSTLTSVDSTRLCVLCARSTSSRTPSVALRRPFFAALLCGSPDAQLDPTAPRPPWPLGFPCLCWPRCQYSVPRWIWLGHSHPPSFYRRLAQTVIPNVMAPPRSTVRLQSPPPSSAFFSSIMDHDYAAPKGRGRPDPRGRATSPRGEGELPRMHQSTEHLSPYRRRLTYDSDGKAVEYISWRLR